MRREPPHPKVPFDPADYSALREMLPAYLHQDFVDEYGSAEKAVQGFLQEASGDEILQVKEDWVRFRKALSGRPLKECQAALGRLGSAWAPQSEAELKRLDEILARYPTADPARPFQPENCAEVVFETGNPVPRPLLRIRREDASRKRLLRARSFWDSLMARARQSQLVYREYSYSSRGDIYILSLSAADRARLAEDAARLARRALRTQLAALPAASHLVFVCPRSSGE